MRSRLVLCVGLLALLVAWPTLASADACASNEDCPACHVCQSGVCLPAPVPPPMCEDDTDCGPAMECVKDECTAWCAAKSEACASDADCGECASCWDGICIALPGFKECDADSDCPMGMQCLGDGCSAWCAPPGMACTSSGDCDPCEVCVAGECLATPGAAPECDADSDCGPGAVCVKDECTAWCAPKSSECSNDADCGPCAFCSDGMCLYPPIAPPECESDSDCGGGTCQKNECTA